ncbi:MAG: MotA/TolQ/ExbB proton channel family protein [Pseudomonadota bacterium]
MDLATILGVLMAFGLVLGSIAVGGSAMAFVNVPSIAIVLGGTTGAVLINYPLADVIGMLRVVKNAFTTPSFAPAEVIRHLVEFAGKARREGLLSLEGDLASIQDKFLVEGIQLAVDGQDAAAIDSVLSQSIESLKERHKLGAEVLTTFGTFAPALGLVGTLVGLVQMLQNMSDPSSIGPSMAVALLTTLYGAILANLVFNPLAGKLRTRSSREVQSRELVLAGVLSICTGDNPRVVERKLLAYLAPQQQAQMTPAGE